RVPWLPCLGCLCSTSRCSSLFSGYLGLRCLLVASRGIGCPVRTGIGFANTLPSFCLRPRFPAAFEDILLDGTQPADLAAHLHLGSAVHRQRRLGQVAQEVVVTVAVGDA